MREARVIAALGRRALTLQFRKTQFLIPTFVLPLMLLAVIASGTSAAQGLRGFPDVASYVAFVVPGTIVQGTLLVGLTAGIALAGDIEGGFFDRLVAAPVARSSIVLGRVCGTVVLCGVQATVFVLVAFVFGARYGGGPAGVAAAVALAALTSIGTAGAAAAIALRTGSMSLLQNLFPFMFMLLFMAPAFFPRDLLAPALRDMAPFNPLTYVVEAVRSLLLGGGGIGDPAAGFATAAALAVAMTFVATLALRARLRSL